MGAQGKWELLAEALAATQGGSGAALREAARLTRSELARAARINEATVWRYEDGTGTPRGEAALRYARALRRLRAIVQEREQR